MNDISLEAWIHNDVSPSGRRESRRGTLIHVVVDRCQSFAGVRQLCVYLNNVIFHRGIQAEEGEQLREIFSQLLSFLIEPNHSGRLSRYPLQYLLASESKSSVSGEHGASDGGPVSLSTCEFLLRESCFSAIQYR